MRQERQWSIIVEHATDVQAAADLARAFDLVLRAADRRRAEREAAAAACPTEAGPTVHHCGGGTHA